MGLWLDVPLDLMVLYSMVASNHPLRYLEVGSGCSTAFVRRAIKDNDLSTRITSIDPKPRAGIDAICDEVLREPLEDLDLAMFERLSAGDVLLVERVASGLHKLRCHGRCPRSSTRLKPGVLVGFDDIYLPDDYPPHWWNRFYSEQYLLAAWLLGGGRGLEIIFPSAFPVADADLSVLVTRLVSKDIFEGLALAKSFWMKKTFQ